LLSWPNAIRGIVRKIDFLNFVTKTAPSAKSIFGEFPLGTASTIAIVDIYGLFRSWGVVPQLLASAIALSLTYVNSNES